MLEERAELRKFPTAIEGLCRLKKRPDYSWTNHKMRMLESLVEKGASNEEIAKELNKRFGGNATLVIVNRKLCYDIYRKRPELRRAASENYQWDTSRVRMVEKLLAQGLTNKQIADVLTGMFEEKATARAVADKLSNDVYKRRPELRRR